MAKDNVGKFYEKLTMDISIAEKLNALDKTFAEDNELPADDDEKIICAFLEKAAASIVLPIASEVGLPFTIEELKAFEIDQLTDMTISEDELDQVCGGTAVQRWGTRHNNITNNNSGCSVIGVSINNFNANEQKYESHVIKMDFNEFTEIMTNFKKIDEQLHLFKN